MPHALRQRVRLWNRNQMLVFNIVPIGKKMLLHLCDQITDASALFMWAENQIKLIVATRFYLFVTSLNLRERNRGSKIFVG